MFRSLLLLATVVSLLSGCLSARYPATAPTARDTGEPARTGGRGNPPFYEVFGQRYHVMVDADAIGYKERGVASWYGGKFHGRSTSSGERYDMHGLTAAHKSLPLPTWVKVTNLRNGSHVIVKVNDRGPFVKNRLIDLSYAAALKLDMVSDGTTLVQVEALQRAEQPILAYDRATAPSDSPPSDSPPSDSPPSDSPPSEVLPDTTATAVAQSTAVSTTPSSPVSAPNDSAPQSGYEPVSATNDTSFVSPAQIFVQVGAFGDAANAQRLRTTLYNAGIDNVRLASGMHLAQPLYRVQVGPVTGVGDYDLLVGQLETLGISETHLITE